MISNAYERLHLLVDEFVLSTMHRWNSNSHVSSCIFKVNLNLRWRWRQKKLALDTTTK